MAKFKVTFTIVDEGDNLTVEEVKEAIDDILIEYFNVCGWTQSDYTSLSVREELMNCPECKSTNIIFSTTRTLTYKVEGVDEEGDLQLGELVEEKEIEEGAGDSFLCLACRHKWSCK